MSVNKPKKKWSNWQGKHSAEVVMSGLNILLQKELGEDYEKSFRKDEHYILKDEKFLNAVTNARTRLGLEEGKRKGVRSSDFDKAVNQALKDAGLSSDWQSYMEDFIKTNQPPEKALFVHPKKIWVEDVNEKNELVIRLKPGLRYEDYLKAWKVFSRPLGNGLRLNKSYSNEDNHLQWLADKDSGMTYLEVAKKHFSHNPEENVEKVKKAILRLKKRLNRDK